ncbi:MAG: hypothetical protein WC686_01930 [Candidatus Shapirobacteria bacterium]|jgi:hypothetical protein
MGERGQIGWMEAMLVGTMVREGRQVVGDACGAAKTLCLELRNKHRVIFGVGEVEYLSLKLSGRFLSLAAACPEYQRMEKRDQRFVAIKEVASREMAEEAKRTGEGEYGHYLRLRYLCLDTLAFKLSSLCFSQGKRGEKGKMLQYLGQIIPTLDDSKIQEILEQAGWKRRD